MARKPRIHYTGAVYHVMLRGNGGQPVFFDQSDYSIFERLIEEGVGRFKYQIHGYCWMPNHIHMVIEVAEIPLSKIIQNLSFRYTRWINKNEDRAGHLFQGRYKAILIDTDNYLLELIRYIHLNPIRSNLVKTLVDYQWSGHQAYLGTQKCKWLTTDWVLQRFDRKKSAARKEYERFVSKGIDEEYRKEFLTGNQAGVALGDDDFIVKLPEFGKSSHFKNKPALKPSEISKQVCSFYKVPESLIKTKTRSRLASKLRACVSLILSEQSGSISQAAEYFGKDLSTLSRQLTNLKQQLTTDKKLEQEIQTLRKQVNASMQA